MSASPWATARCVVAERAPSGAEQVQRADHLPPQPQGHRVGGAEPDLACGPGEDRPPVRGGGEVDVGDDLAGGEAVQARPLLLLQLEELQQARGLVGVRDQSQVAALVVEHQPRGVGVDQLDAALGEGLQQVHHVELLDQGVGQFDEDLGQALLTHHAIPPPGVAASCCASRRRQSWSSSREARPPRRGRRGPVRRSGVPRRKPGRAAAPAPGARLTPARTETTPVAWCTSARSSRTARGVRGRGPLGGVLGLQVQQQLGGGVGERQGVGEFLAGQLRRRCPGRGRARRGGCRRPAAGRRRPRGARRRPRRRRTAASAAMTRRPVRAPEPGGRCARRPRTAPARG